MKKLANMFIMFIVCNFVHTAAGEWTTPVPVQSGINTQYSEVAPYLSYDGLSLYYTEYYNSYTNSVIFEAKRSQPSGNFTSVSQVFSTYGHAYAQWVSPDNLRMYYHQEYSTWEIKMSQRASVNEPWPQGTLIAGLPSGICTPSLSSDELIIVFDNPNVGNWDMFIATRPDKNSPFGNLRNLSELNTAGIESRPFLSPDALSIYYGNGAGQILKATRQSLNDPFGNITHLSQFDMPYGSGHPAISSDGKEFYFVSAGADMSADIFVSYLIAEPLTVNVDIKPGSCPNPFNVKSKGVLPVAILGTDDFDVNTIDPNSIRLAGVAPIRSAFEDVASPAADVNDCNCVSTGPDGITDLTLKFDTQKIAQAIGDVNQGDIVTLTLTGTLLDEDTETTIEGADCIVIVGAK